jgi:hypothetical protein
MGTEPITPKRDWRGQLARQGITPEQFVFQFLIVAAGVWLAIVIGNNTAAQQRHIRANASLRAVLEELRQDEADIKAIIAAQDSNLAVIREFASKARNSSTSDAEIADILEKRLTANRTLFPRRAAYTIMVNGEQLADLSDSALRLKIAELYDHNYVRLVNNGSLSDEISFAFRYGILDYWDYEKHTIIKSPAAALKVSNLAHRFFVFNGFYVTNLKEGLKSVQSVQRSITAYLD